MFKNHGVLVKVVKNDEQQLVQNVINYDALARTITSSVITIIGAYMASDALRKIFVHVVATKVN